jgi:spore coat polysaccharide biosynthesis protein SpsF
MLKTFYENDLLIDTILKKFEGLVSDIPVILATTINEKDNILEEYANKYSLLCYRGSEDDVLKRFIEAAEKHHIDVVIRVCADNPFLSVEYIKHLISAYQNAPSNYISYQNSDGIPTIRTHYGFFSELVELSALKKVAGLTNEKLYQEHVTNYIYDHAKDFSINLLKIPFSENNSTRLTIDTIDDFIISQEIYSDLKRQGKDTEPSTIMAYLNANIKYFNTMNEQIKNQKK